jgi:hypothetical protein
MIWGAMARTWQKARLLKRLPLLGGNAYPALLTTEWKLPIQGVGVPVATEQCRPKCAPPLKFLL